MCRWIAYTGEPIFIDQLVTIPRHSLVQQSFDSKMRLDADGDLLALNGDGFGMGWYAGKPMPGLFKDEQPAWSNRNFRNLCEQIKAHIFFSHVRAATSGEVKRSNAHPFKYKNWLFQHNGHVHGFEAIRQHLHSEISRELYCELKGTTDSETLFLLALSFGLEDDPKEGFKQMVYHVREACEDMGIETIMNLSCALSDGETLYTLRYAEGEPTNTQFYSTHFNISKSAGLNEQDCPDPGEFVVLVSEPLNQVSSDWHEVPENTFATIRNNKIRFETFI